MGSPTSTVGTQTPKDRHFIRKIQNKKSLTDFYFS